MSIKKAAQKGDPTNTIIAQLSEAVNNHDLAEVLKLTEISSKDAVTEMRRYFPKFDKTMLSKCSNPTKYGCVLHPTGFRALTGLSDTVPEMALNSPEKRLKDYHKNTCRISARLSDSKFALLQQVMHDNDIETMQELLENLVDEYIEKEQKMTRKEKIEAIVSACSLFRQCIVCNLDKYEDACCNKYQKPSVEATDEEINRDYEIMFGGK